MRIIVDAMGGDNAPMAVVQGAIDAAREFGVDMILVGHGEAILRCLNEIGLDNLPKGIEVANADDVVMMDDDPAKISKAIRISKRCMKIVYENIYFAIGIKLLCLLLVALGKANMWLAIFSDVGVMVIAVLNAIRALNVKKC